MKAICAGLASSANYPDQWSDATIIRCKLHCERVKLFVSLLGGAAYAAFSRDFRSLLYLRFYQRVYGCQSSVLSNSRVYISTSFIFQENYSYISGFAITTSRANNIHSRCATTWLPTSPSGGYSAAPLPNSHCESDRLSLLSLVRMTLTRNNHCERGLSPFPDESADVNQSWCQSDSFPIRLNYWPHKTPQVLCLEGQFVWSISIPIWICTRVPNMVPIAPAVW